MKYRALTSTGDFTLGQGKSGYLTDTLAVAQAIKTKLKLLKGEWWEDVQEGLPLFQRILNRRGTDAALESVELIIRDRILETPHVLAVTSYKADFDRKTREYSAKITVETEYGSNAEIFVTY